MGVSLRYWSRWSLESFPSSFGFLEKYILPAILNSGDAFGIVPMEFPLINILTAPFFVFGHEMGRGLAASFLYLITFVLTIIHAKVWKGKKILGLQTYPAFLLLPICSIGLTWSCKFMPDYLSLLFVSMGVGLLWDISETTKINKRSLSALLFCFLGLLLKPTSASVFFFFLGNPSLLRIQKLFLQTRKFNQCKPLLITFSLVAISLSLSFIYFTKIKTWIGTFQDVPNTFYLKMIPLSQSWQELLANPIPFLKLFGQVFFFLGGIFFILGILIIKTQKTKRYSVHGIWLIIFIQFIFIGLLTGQQGYSHLYYFIGSGPLCCLLFFAAWKYARLGFIRVILVLGFVIPLFERFGMDLKNYVQPWRKDTTYEECRKLISNNSNFPWDQGYIFRSPRERFPQLGVCFGERQGSQKNEFGFSYLNEPLKGCHIIDATHQIGLFRCY